MSIIEKLDEVIDTPMHPYSRAQLLYNKLSHTMTDLMGSSYLAGFETGLAVAEAMFPWLQAAKVEFAIKLIHKARVDAAEKNGTAGENYKKLMRID